MMEEKEKQRIQYELSSFRERYILTFIADQLKFQIISYLPTSAHTDVIIFSGGTKILIEFKFKNESIDHKELQHRGLMIKPKKFYNCQKEADKYNLPVLYINYFAKSFAFTITDMFNVEHQVGLIKRKVDAGYNQQERIETEMYFFPLSSSTIYNMSYKCSYNQWTSNSKAAYAVAKNDFGLIKFNIDK